MPLEANLKSFRDTVDLSAGDATCQRRCGRRVSVGVVQAAATFAFGIADPSKGLFGPVAGPRSQ